MSKNHKGERCLYESMLCQEGYCEECEVYQKQIIGKRTSTKEEGDNKWKGSGGGTLVVSAKLQLDIVENADNWGKEGRLVEAHRLTTDWTEGNQFKGEAGISKPRQV